jgi:hypothetical protein
MPTIKIFRKKERSTRFKVIELYLDGQRFGYISNGETKEFEVTAGQHTLKAKMGWYGSKNFDCTIFNKESKSYAVYPNYILSSFLIIIVLCIILIHSYLISVHKISHSYIWIFPAIIILIAAIYQILGRYIFLTLKEDL